MQKYDNLSSIHLRLINISLRISTLSSRFLLFFFLAKFLNPTSLGHYGLFAAAVGYAIYFVGFDFYIYAIRDIIVSSADRRGTLLKSQAALSGLLYVIFFPFALVFINFAIWPTNITLFFFPILILEHFNQEQSRLLTALSDQIASSIINFIRLGLWPFGIVIIMSLDPGTRTLETVMIFWVFSGAIAAALGLWRLRQLKINFLSPAVDWAWVKKGIVISSAFLVATLALRGFQTIDKYWLEYVGGIEIVGAYVLLLGVASTMMTILDAGLFSYVYPALISHIHVNNASIVHVIIKKTLIQTVLFCFFFSTVSIFLLPYLLDWIGNPAYNNNLHWYPWLLMAMTLNSVSMVPHYGLYALGLNKPRIYSHIFGFFVFIFTTWFFVYSYQSFAIAIGLNAAFAAILIWKSVAYLNAIKNKLAD